MRSIIAVVGIVGIASAIGARQLPKGWFFADGWHWTSQGETVAVDGICSVGSEPASCWNPNRANDPELTDEVRAYFKANPKALIAWPGRKTRLVALSRDGMSGVTWEIYAPGKASVSEIRNNRYGEKVGWVLVQAFPNQTRVSLQVLLWDVPDGPAVALPLRNGAQVMLQGTCVEYAGCREAPVSEGAYHPPEYPLSLFQTGLSNAPKRRIHSWGLYIHADGGLPYAVYTPLDRKGNVIAYVDDDGRPASETQFRAQAGARVAASRHFSPACIGMPGVEDQAILLRGDFPGVITSNVNPRFIDAVRMEGRRRPNIVFSDLPLDPAPAPLGGTK